MNIDLKKVYYYVIALITFFVMLWGVIDLASALGSSFTGKYLPVPQEMRAEEPNLEEYYQKRVTQDRIFDSLARAIIAGGIFIYARRKAEA